MHARAVHARTWVHADFPHIAAFIDLLLLYEEEESSRVKLVDGTWAHIPVREGFSRGCTFSPIMTVVVLNHIPTKVEARLDASRSRRRISGLEDNLGGDALIPYYADDANFRMFLEDINLQAPA